MQNLYALLASTNQKSKAGATFEILSMLIVSAALGYMLRWYQTEGSKPKSSDDSDSFIPDNLQKIKGIDSAIEALLNESGIRTFEDLADTTKGQLTIILNKSRKDKLKHANPSSWPKQARLAANGDWDELEELQKK